MNIQSGKIEQFETYSQFTSLKDFNTHFELWLTEKKQAFSKGELIGLKRLARFSAKIPGVANAKIGTILKAINEEYHNNGISRSTFKRMVQKAIQQGILTVYETERKNGSQSSNLYIFNRFPSIEPPEAEKMNHPRETIDLSKTNHQKITKRQPEPSQLHETFVCNQIAQQSELNHTFVSGRDPQPSELNHTIFNDRVTQSSVLNHTFAKSQESQQSKLISGRAPQPSELNHTFTSDRVPQPFVQLAKYFFPEAKTIEDMWHMVKIAAYRNNSETQTEQVLEIAIHSFKQLIRKMKLTQTVKKPIAYFYGILDKQFERAYYVDLYDMGFGDRAEFEF